MRDILKVLLIAMAVAAVNSAFGKAPVCSLPDPPASADETDGNEKPVVHKVFALGRGFVSRLSP